MKKVVLLFILVLLMNFPAIAGQDYSKDDTDNSVETTQNEYCPAEDIWNQTMGEYIYENYGSDQSPSFSGRGNINPNEDTYEYNGATGD